MPVRNDRCEWNLSGTLWTAGVPFGPLAYDQFITRGVWLQIVYADERKHAEKPSTSNYSAARRAIKFRSLLLGIQEG